MHGRKVEQRHFAGKVGDADGGDFGVELFGVVEGNFGRNRFDLLLA